MNEPAADLTFATDVGSVAGKRVLITGCTGFVGRAVVQEGRDRGAHLFGFTRTSASIPDVRMYQLDLTDRAAVRHAVGEVAPDAVIHLAATGVVSDSSLADVLRGTTLGTAELLAAVESVNPAAPVVLAGSGYEYAPADRPLRETDPEAPITAYGIAKAAATLCARWHGARMGVAVLRLFNVYGPGESLPRLVPYMASCARAGRRMMLTSGTQVRDYVHVRDAAEAFWRAVVQVRGVGFHLWNVGSGNPVTLRTFIEQVMHCLSEHGLPVDVEFGARPTKVGEPAVYAADITELRKAFQWSPSIPLEEGLRETVAALVS